jgi:hypothetical protein
VVCIRLLQSVHTASGSACGSQYRSFVEAPVYYYPIRACLIPPSCRRCALAAPTLVISSIEQQSTCARVTAVCNQSCHLLRTLLLFFSRNCLLLLHHLHLHPAAKPPLTTSAGPIAHAVYICNMRLFNHYETSYTCATWSLNDHAQPAPRHGENSDISACDIICESTALRQCVQYMNQDGLCRVDTTLELTPLTQH